MSYINTNIVTNITVIDAALSSDFISGFCGETEEEHRDSFTLLEYVKYQHAFMFAYSMREKTHAHRNFAYVVVAK